MSLRLRLVAVAAVIAAAVVVTVTGSEAAGPTWTRENPSTRPPARAFASMAYDDTRDEVVLFGGANPGALGDTWTWDGASWTRKTPAVSPPARASAAMAFDPVTRKIVLFGGSDSAQGTGRLFGDTWAWDGANWSLLISEGPVSGPAADGPSARRSSVMAPDANGRLVLFGGATAVPLNETWTWDGAASHWSRAAPTTSPPSETARAGMAYDPVRRQTVLFASKSAETWTWDGIDWSRKAPGNAPRDREAPAMAYDARSETVVLFGGVALRDTWTWDGGNWTQQASPDAPGATSDASMTQNPRKSPGDRSILYFGGILAGFADETWTWDSGVRFPPVVTGVAPAHGSIAGGTPVVIAGSRFSGVTQVHFGAEPSATVPCPGVACTITNDSTIVVTAPPHAPATVDIVVTNSLGSSAVTGASRFTFLDAVALPPLVTAVSPRSGSTKGGRSVTISGANLDGATGVQFGAAAVPCPGAACTVVSTNQITVTSPPHAPGIVHVIVSSPEGSSSPTDADKFTFAVPLTAPVVTGVEPLVGSTDGGEPVVLRGAGLADITKVRFGPEEGSALSCPSARCTVGGDTEINVITPVHGPESVHVTVLTDERSSVATDADVFTFVVPSTLGGLRVVATAAIVRPGGHSPFQGAPPVGSPVGTPLAVGGAAAAALSGVAVGGIRRLQKPRRQPACCHSY
ncbi:MAG TPA: IPT/TIG domain-containing protein [Acidimicrobiales bacterium]|nr:IPT/TIG domain-containing protein [Acidimicrobiales bacterium]